MPKIKPLKWKRSRSCDVHWSECERHWIYRYDDERDGRFYSVCLARIFVGNFPTLTQAKKRAQDIEIKLQKAIRLNAAVTFTVEELIDLLIVEGVKNRKMELALIKKVFDG